MCGANLLRPSLFIAVLLDLPPRSAGAERRWRLPSARSRFPPAKRGSDLPGGMLAERPASAIIAPPLDSAWARAGAARGTRLTLAPRRWAFIGLLWLALATIFAHALAPTGSPLRRSSGSAFNPFTSEVAIGPKRAALPDKARHAERVSNDGDRTGGNPIVAILAWAAPGLRLRPPAGRVDMAGAESRRPRRAGGGAFQARAPPFA
jgi:hypothetical protein